MKITVIATGGTIGSVEKDGKRSPATEALQRLTMCCTGLEAIQLSWEFPFITLSENMTTALLYDLVAAVATVIDRKECDGIIVTHGTDTLAFTAQYLAQVFCGSPVPIVLVSADAPLTHHESNGPDNFDAAVTLIKTGARGVFVAYRNHGEPCKIHLGGRVLDPSCWDGVVDSLGSVVFGTVINNSFVHNDDPKNPTMQQLDCCRSSSIGELLDTSVVTLSSRSLLDFDLLGLAQTKPRAVVLEPYHSGSVCSVGDGTSFFQFAASLKKNGIALIVAPFAPSVYQGSEAVSDVCIPAHGQSAVAATVKTMLLLGNGFDVTEQSLNTIRCFERIEEK